MLPTATTLRADWKSAVEHHGIADTDTALRMHRVCKWFEEGQALRQGGHLDMACIACWVGFNALYARWGEPETFELTRIKACLGTLHRLDKEEFLLGFALMEKKRIEAIFNHPFLSHYLWQERLRAGDGHDAELDLTEFVQGNDALRWLREGRLLRLLEGLLGRVYVLRNQLVHGGATPGSKVNRTQIELVGPVLENFLAAVIQIQIHAENQFEDWGRVPYPVVEGAAPRVL